MSILIKGMEMEMPRNCWECEFNKSTLDRMDFCTLTNKQYNWGLSERPSDCPLIEVPEDVRPVVHGKWKQKKETLGRGPMYAEIYVWECTVCKCVTPVDVDKYNYCPVCGAKMDS